MSLLRDQNRVAVAGGVSNVDSTVVLPFKIDSVTGRVLIDSSSGGTVTSVSVVSANGLAGSVATPTTTPAITLSTTITGILQGNGTAISAATTTGTGSVVLNTSPTLTTPVINGLPTGTGVASSATASTLASRDASANLTVNNIINRYATTVTAAGTTTLTVTSAREQFFTGTTTQTVVMPDATTLALGFQFRIHNNSTGLVTVNANGGGGVWVLGASSDVLLTVTDVSTAAGVWDAHYMGTGIASGKKLSFANSLLFSGTDGSSVAFGTGGTVLYSGGALGTPSSGTLTNATGLPLTTGVTGTLPLANGGTAANLTASTGGVVYSGASALAILAGTATANKVLMSGASAAPVWSTPTYPNASATLNKVIKSDGTNFVASTETYAAPGTSGNVMTSDGTNWTSAAPASSVPNVITLTTDYSVAGLYSAGVTNSGTNTFGANNLGGLTTSTGGLGSARVLWIWQNNSNLNFFARGSRFGAAFYVNILGTDFDFFVGLNDVTGVSTTAITFTSNHYGFKVIRTASGVVNLYGTQANGTTETATASLVTLAQGDFVEVLAVYTLSTNVIYYYSVNGAAWSAGSTLTTNLPSTSSTGLSQGVLVAISSHNVTTSSTFDVKGTMITR